jgi:hypothetical protein
MISLRTGDVIFTRWYALLNQQLSVNTINFLVIADPASTWTDVTLLATLAGTVAPVYKPLLNSGAEFGGSSITTLLGATGKIATKTEYEIFGQGPGLGGTQPLPTQTSIIVQLKTNGPGKGGLGRIYIPFPSTTDNANGGVPAGAYQAKVDTFRLAVYTRHTYTDAGKGIIELEPIIWHRKTKNYDLVESTKVHTLWATQRRRGSYGRLNNLPSPLV